MLKVRLQLRKVIAIAICLAGSAIMFAQDVITLRNGYEIKAVVFEVGPDEVKYKKFDNQDGPNYKLKTSDIVEIRYQNGTKDDFGQMTSPAPKVQQQTSNNQRTNANSRNTYESTAPPATVQRQTQNNQQANAYSRDTRQAAPTTAYQQPTARPVRMSGSDLVYNMSLDNPQLYRKYRSGSTLKGIGMGLTLGGLAAAVVGFATADQKTTTSDGTTKVSFTGTGGAILSVGITCAVVGTPIWIIGGSKKKSARNAYLRSLSYEQPTPHFQFQTSSNGLGLAYIF